MEKATFAAGCFWGVEEAFTHLKGVKETVVGYTGGHTENPNYEQVCSHSTGHAEALEITFDSTVISYNELLNKFWEIHNPTILNRQGPDTGDNYRSAIFYHSLEQKRSAEESKKELEKSGKYENKIVTEIVPVQKFYEAEEYHQEYNRKHGIDSCPIY